MNKLQPEPLAPRLFWTPIEAVEIKPALSGHKFKGHINLGPSRLHPKQHKRYAVEFDNLRDLIVMLESITLDCGGRIFRARSPIVSKAKLEIEQVHACTWSECTVDKPMEAEFLEGHYLAITMMGGDVYHQWFVNVEDLVQQLHRVAMDVQGLTKSVTAGAVRAALTAPGGNHA